MSYRDDVGRLARALAELLTTDPLPAESLTPLQVQAALTCRDSVVGAVRDLTSALLRPTPAPLRADPAMLVGSPTHALHAALSDLPRTADRTLPLLDALDVRAVPPIGAWQRAARASVALERYRDDVAALPGPAAWSLARDVASLASVLPALDGDLAATVSAPRTVSASSAGSAPNRSGTVVSDAVADDAAAALVDEPSHGFLQFTAAELAAHTGDVPHAAVSLPGSRRLPLLPVLDLADLPGAGQQLAQLVRHRAHRLTVTEARAVLRTVTYGVDLTARVLASGSSAVPVAAHGSPATPSRDTAGVRYMGEAASELRTALPDLQHVLHAQLATLTPPSQAVLFLCKQTQNKLATADDLQDALARSASPDIAGHALAQALARWAVTAAPVVDAVRGALHAAAERWDLLGTRLDAAPGPHARLLWLPLRTGHAHPALQAADRASSDLKAAASTLGRLLEQPAVSPAVAARRAAADASAAFGQLTAALQTRRPAPVLPNPSRAAHPALPGTRIASTSRGRR